MDILNIVNDIKNVLVLKCVSFKINLQFFFVKKPKTKCSDDERSSQRLLCAKGKD